MIPREKSIPTFESRSFAARIDGTPGAHTLTVLARPYFQTFLNAHFKPGDEATLLITGKKPKRTEAQSRYYWVYLSEISRETGNDPDDLHEFFKAEFLPSKAVEVLGRVVIKRASTTTLTRTEFSEYIEKIAGLTGIEPPPVETIRGL